MNNTKTKIQNPFQLIYKSPKCKRPYDFPLSDFPFLLDIEVTNSCNLDCLMCPRQLMTRKIGFMKSEVFEKIIKEASLYKPGMRFIGFGEPLLHKEIFSFIRLIKECGLICHITTNGLLMDKNMIDEIVASGLDSIIFSFQGYNKVEYEMMRNNNNYDLLKSNIYNLRRRRDKEGLNRPFIQVTTTFLDESEEEKIKFFKKWQKVSDKVDYWHTSLLRLTNINRVKPLLSRQRVKEITGKGRCIEAMTKLTINWDGKVSACCADHNGELVIGDIRNSGLKNLWNSAKLNRIRDILSEGKREDISFCSLCTTKFVE